MRWIVVFLVVMAGCAEAPVDEAGEDFLEAEPTATTGSITGVVVDETIAPISGALIAVRSLDLEATSDEEGRFAFTGLEPGLYSLNVTAPKFFSVQQVADVTAGSKATLRILLASDPTPDPYFETYAFKGQIVFHATVAWAQLEWMLDTYAGVSTPACECVFTFESSGVPQGHVFEAVWEDNIADPQGETEYYWSYAVPDPYQELFGYAASPIYRTWEEAPFEETGEYKVMLLGDADGVSFQQDFEIFLTQWYHTSVPDGWSIVQDS